MIKVLSVSGSPVVNSSTDILLAETEQGIAEGIGSKSEVAVTIIKLNDLAYTPCQACGKAPSPDWCFFHDSLDTIYPLVAECDCLLFGSPVYFDSVSGQAKMFIDRCNCFRPYDFDGKHPEHRFIKLLPRKRPGGIVLVGGDEIGFESARRTVAGLFKWIEVVNCGVLKYASSDDRRSGTAQDDPSILRDARELGKKLAREILNAI